METSIKNPSNTNMTFEKSPSSEKRQQMDLELYEGLLTAIGYFSFVAGIPGIVANILIIITYTKIGINSSINTSYTSMAISDIGCILTTIGFEYLTIPHIVRSGILPIVDKDWLPVIGYPNLAFTKITSCITAYISVERCLCVASPHKVKLFFTKKLTMFVLTLIFIVCILPLALMSMFYEFEWKVSEIFPNKTVLGVSPLWTPRGLIVYQYIQFMYGVFLHWIPISLTLICSIFLIIHLNAGSKWRSHSVQTTNTSNQQDGKVNKEDRIVKAVLAIAIISIVLSTPLSINFVLNLIDTRNLPFYGENYNLMNDIRACLFTTVLMLNSCFNIFIYYKLGSKFRSTLRQLLHCNGGRAES